MPSVGYAPIPDEDFAKDVQEGIDSRRDSFERAQRVGAGNAPVSQ